MVSSLRTRVGALAVVTVLAAPVVGLASPAGAAPTCGKTIGSVTVKPGISDISQAQVFTAAGSIHNCTGAGAYYKSATIRAVSPPGGNHFTVATLPTTAFALKFTLTWHNGTKSKWTSTLISEVLTASTYEWKIQRKIASGPFKGKTARATLTAKSRTVGGVITGFTFVGKSFKITRR
jgi:hypothetical protein